MKTDVTLTKQPFLLIDQLVKIEILMDKMSSCNLENCNMLYKVKHVKVI